jgi:1A family penicillin-binding protein
MHADPKERPPVRQGTWRRWWRFARLGLLLGAVAGLVLAGAAAAVLLRLPPPAAVPEALPAFLALEGQDGSLFAQRGVLRGDAIAADRLPKPLADAVVAIEDRRFGRHAGLDLRGMARALWRNIAEGRTREGGSTITQQLARLLYLSQDRTLLRKGQEALIALWLERQLPKDEILARYLSQAYFGAGARGADAAARRYFGKRAGELSLAEAAMMAGLVRAPTQLAPTRNLDGARRRAETVLAAMVETGRITASEAEAARAAPATPKVPPEPPQGPGYFADWAEAEARRLAGGLPIDLAAGTTLNPALQDLAERVVAAQLERAGPRARAGQAALVAMAHDGAVLALVGGRDYGASQFNRATQARRQPGSLFKLFVYAAALEAGMAPDSTVVDQPVRLGGWEPRNFSEGHVGATTLRLAFAHSINTVAVQLSEAVGRARVIEMARRLGLRSAVPPVPSLALGSAEATLLELTGSFATVAAGRRVEPYGLRELRTRERTLWRFTDPLAHAPPPLSPAVRQGMLDLLLSVVREGTGAAARLDRPVAGKTGTTQEHRDAWFIGFTADLVVGVWVGNDDNTPMHNVIGGELPATIWREVVDQAYRRRLLAPQGTAVAQPAPLPAVVRPTALRGAPEVLDTATLRLGGQVVRLAGVLGLDGEHAEDMAAFLAGREVACEPDPATPGFHRCRAGERDLAEVVLSNGGGRAAADAQPGHWRAEQQARSEGRGIWGR